MRWNRVVRVDSRGRTGAVATVTTYGDDRWLARPWHAAPIIAAGTVLAEGQQVPEGVLVAGVPGKVRRDLSEQERAAIERNAATYIGLSRLHRRGEA